MIIADKWFEKHVLWLAVAASPVAHAFFKNRNRWRIKVGPLSLAVLELDESVRVIFPVLDANSISEASSDSSSQECQTLIARALITLVLVAL